MPLPSGGLPTLEEVLLSGVLAGVSEAAFWAMLWLGRSRRRASRRPVTVRIGQLLPVSREGELAPCEEASGVVGG
jgi:hypothetical protein